MDKATRPASQEIDPSTTTSDGDAQKKSPDQIRQDIQETRAELGDTVEALVEKSDVKGQVKGQLAEAKDTLTQKKDEYLARAKEATPDSANSGAQQLAATAQQKPVPFAVGGGFATGLLLGLLLGRRRTQS